MIKNKGNYFEENGTAYSVIMKGLSIDVKKRYQTIEDFWQEIKEI